MADSVRWCKRLSAHDILMIMMLAMMINDNVASDDDHDDRMDDNGAAGIDDHMAVMTMKTIQEGSNVSIHRHQLYSQLYMVTI